MINKQELLIRALKGRAAVYSLIGEYDSSIEEYNKVITSAKKSDSHLISDTILDIAYNYIIGKNDPIFAQKLITNMFRKYSKRLAPILYARGQNLLGSIYDMRGYSKTALKYYKKALSTYKKINDLRGILGTSGNLGRLYRERGNLNIAFRYFKETLPLLKKLGDKRVAGIINLFIGHIYYDYGELNISLRYYRKFLKLSTVIDYKMGISGALGNIGVVYQALGKPNIALKYQKNSIEVAKSINFKEGIGNGYLNLGLIYFEDKKIKKAEEYFKKAQKIFEDTGFKDYLSGSYLVFSKLEFSRRNYKSAYKFAIKALSVAEKIGGGKDRIASLRNLGKILCSPELNSTAKIFKKGIFYLEKSVFYAKKLSMQFEYGESLYELGKAHLHFSERLRVEGEREGGVAKRLPLTVNRETKKKAAKYLKEAERIFKKAGAKLWLKKTKNLITQLPNNQIPQ